MIEVLAAGDGWTWVLLCARGRVLVYTDEIYPTDSAAADAAKAYRAAFWAVADSVDHRQERAI